MPSIRPILKNRGLLRPKSSGTPLDREDGGINLRHRCYSLCGCCCTSRLAAAELPRNPGASLRRLSTSARDSNGRCPAGGRIPGTKKKVSGARLLSIFDSAVELHRRSACHASFISRSRSAQNTGEAGHHFLFASNGTCSAGKYCRNRWNLHSARGRHQAVAPKTTADSIQTLDAQSPRAVVGGALVGLRDVRAVVHSLGRNLSCYTGELTHCRRQEWRPR